jgi:NAD(P)-dependent dehydrogenase (short-subunit alcohol dehydrogenase family)
MTDFLTGGMSLYADRSGRTAADELAAWLRQVPLRMAAEPSDIAQLICYLASDAARFVTGQSWNIDGGMVFD